jgi:hypothetical protein
MKTIALVAVITFVSGMAAASETKNVYRVFRLSANEVAVSCSNGADPTTFPKLTGQDALIISCGK